MTMTAGTPELPEVAVLHPPATAEFNDRLRRLIASVPGYTATSVGGDWREALERLRSTSTSAVLAIDESGLPAPSTLEAIRRRLADGARYVSLVRSSDGRSVSTTGRFVGRAVARPLLDVLDWKLWDAEASEGSALEQLAQPLVEVPAEATQFVRCEFAPAVEHESGASESGIPGDLADAKLRTHLRSHPTDAGAARLMAAGRLVAGDPFDAERALLRSAVLCSDQSVAPELARAALARGAVSEARAYLALGSRPPAVHQRRTPTVTVGLPVYSGGELLAGAIAAVLDQDFEDLELIVYDVGADPVTREVCGRFSDVRLRHVVTGARQDFLGLNSIVNSMESSQSPYFMWASYDDRHDARFVSRCVDVLERREDVALVYGRTRLLDAEGRDAGLAQDGVDGDHGDAAVRYRHLIWRLSLCNAWYGLFRRSALRQTRSLGMNLLRGHDTLFLAEMALLGRIVQLDNVLFTRRLSRPTTLGFEQAQADVLRSWEPRSMLQGLTLPICRLAVAHCDVVQASSLPRRVQSALIDETLHCFRERRGGRMLAEIDRLVGSIRRLDFERQWDDDAPRQRGHDAVRRLHLPRLLARLAEAALIYPERTDIPEAESIVRAELVEATKP